ncbi:MAG: hypothetical protein ACRCX2_27330 [Paraclostridium sp.]
MDKISVDFNKHKKMWRLRIRIKNTGNKHIGYYPSKIEALLEGIKITQETTREVYNGKT